MNNVIDYISVILLDHYSKLFDDYEVTRNSEFVNERMEVLSKYKWNPHAKTIAKLSHFNMVPLLKLQYMTRASIMDEFNLTDRGARTFKEFAKMTQLVCEIQLYGLYQMKVSEKFIRRDLHPRYLMVAADDVESGYWRPRFKSMMNGFN